MGAVWLILGDIYFILGLAHCWEHRCTTGVCWVRCRHCRQIIQDMNNLLAEQIIQDMNNLLAERRWGNQKAESLYEKKKAITESRKQLRKAERRWGKPLQKAERRWGKPLQKAERRWGKPLRKLESHWQNLESHWGYWKAVDKTWKAVEENGNFGVSCWHQNCYHACSWIYFVNLKYSQFKINHHSDTPSIKGDRRWNLQWCDYQGR